VTLVLVHVVQDVVGIMAWESLDGTKEFQYPTRQCGFPKLVEIKDCGKACVRGFGGFVSPWKEYDDDKYMSEQDWNVFA
jgi:hypothetical protein